MVLRPVRLKDGVRLQVSRDDGQRPHTANVSFDEAEATLGELLAQPYGNWLVETTTRTVTLRVTKRGEAQVHTSDVGHEQRLDHDRAAPHLMPPDDALFGALRAGAAKRRQVDAFLRAVDPLLKSYEDSVAIADLGCGNAYLTFALSRYAARLGLTASTVGVDVRADQRERNTALAMELGMDGTLRFEAASIEEANVSDADLVVALHACDTATDDALARGVAAGARHIVAAPCCHHDLAAQLKAGGVDGGRALLGDGILRERFADVLTDALRAQLLRLHGYRVDVIEFIDSAHTPRNTLIRATRTGGAASESDWAHYRDLTTQWNVKPRLGTLLGAA